MIAVDTNILVYAHRGDSLFFAAARNCMAKLAEGAASWGIPWPCVHEFLSVATNPRMYKPSSSLAEALDQVDAWLESPGLVMLSETELHWETLGALLTRGQVRGPVIHDARIAAICIENNVNELWSADRDFNRFPGLKVVNPLV